MTTAADSVLWYWGDGTSDTGNVVSHTYTSPFGTFNIYQVVFNTCGSSDSVLHAVDVCDTMQITTGYTVGGLSATFTTTGSQGTGCLMPGILAMEIQVPEVVPRTYTGAGSYTVVCTVTSYCGQTMSDTILLEICNPVNLSFSETGLETTLVLWRHH